MRRKTAYQTQRNRTGGFTLIEVLVTLAVIAIVFGISAPALRSLAPNMRLKSVARDTYSFIQNAKMLAIKENRIVTVRFDSPGIVYQDEDGSGAFETGEPFVLLGEDLNNNDVMDDNGTLNDGEDFNENGILDKNSGVKYGTGTAANNNGFTDTNNSIQQATSTAFNSRGIPTVTPVDATKDVGIYLSNEDNINCYAVQVSTAGSIQLHRWNGAWD